MCCWTSVATIGCANSWLELFSLNFNTHPHQALTTFPNRGLMLVLTVFFYSWLKLVEQLLPHNPPPTHVVGVGVLVHKVKLGVCKLICIACNGFLIMFEDNCHQVGLFLVHHILFFFLVGSYYTLCTSFPSWKLLHIVFSFS